MVLSKWISSSVVIAVLSIRTSGQTASDDAMSLFQRVLKTESTATYRGRQFVETKGQPSDSRTLTDIVHISSQRNLVRYLSPKILAGSIVAVRDRVRREYYPAQNTVLETRDLGNPKLPNIEAVSKLVNEGYRISAFPWPSPVNGKQTKVLSFTPKQRDRASFKWYVEPISSFVLRRETLNPDGTIALVTGFESVEFDMRIRDSEVNWKAPPGVKTKIRKETKELTDWAAASSASPRWCDIPRTLHGGFTFESARIIKSRGETMVVVLYSDGLMGVSLIQSQGDRKDPEERGVERPVRIGSGTGRFVESLPPYLLLRWSRKNVTLSLVSDLPRETIMKIAEAIR